MHAPSHIEGFKIVVLDKGFVYAGHVVPMDGGVLIHSARNIRVWGTEYGLGQLAKSGPTNTTVLDPTGNVFAPWHAVVHLIDTDESKWKK
jgi:hypothetical protein